MARRKRLDVCPAGMMTVSGKWKFWILYYLLGGTRRFGELQRLIPEASRQMLTMQLRDLEQMGMLHREVYAQVPPKVEYWLTPMGRGLEPMLRQSYEWGKWYCSQYGIDYEWPEIEGMGEHAAWQRSANVRPL